jgi:hypothetical protein
MEEQRQGVETDIDLRLTPIWMELIESEQKQEITIEIIAALLRAAYGQGYTDALKEPHGKLMKDHGYRVPRRRRGDTTS